MFHSSQPLPPSGSFWTFSGHTLDSFPLQIPLLRYSQSPPKSRTIVPCQDIAIPANLLYHKNVLHPRVLGISMLFGLRQRYPWMVLWSTIRPEKLLRIQLPLTLSGFSPRDGLTLELTYLTRGRSAIVLKLLLKHLIMEPGKINYRGQRLAVSTAPAQTAFPGFPL